MQTPIGIGHLLPILADGSLCEVGCPLTCQPTQYNAAVRFQGLLELCLVCTVWIAGFIGRTPIVPSPVRKKPLLCPALRSGVRIGVSGGVIPSGLQISSTIFCGARGRPALRKTVLAIPTIGSLTHGAALGAALSEVVSSSWITFLLISKRLSSLSSAALISLVFSTCISLPRLSTLLP